MNGADDVKSKSAVIGTALYIVFQRIPFDCVRPFTLYWDFAGSRYADGEQATPDPR